MGESMAFYAAFSSTSNGNSPSASAGFGLDPVIFSVPPPPPSGKPCSSCGSCIGAGNRLGSSSSTVIVGQSEEDRTFALQLRAAAVFNKTDVPPPPVLARSSSEPVPLHIPPPPPAVPSYPPPVAPPSALSFTRYPPPINATSPPFIASHHHPVGQQESVVVVVSSSSEASSSSSSSCCCCFDGAQDVPTTLSSTPSLFCGSSSSSSPSGMKRMSDMEAEESPVKRPRPGGDTELRLLIQSKAAGSVIGKGGQNISRLRSENPASITVPDCPGPERVLSIGGSEEVVMKVLEEVLESLDEASQKDDDDSDVRILVHHSQAGCIIGKGGSKIKELRELCGGQVKVYSNCCPQSSDRVIQIIGDRQRALLTIGNILESLRDSPIKGINNSYNPHNFDEYYAQEYGGWSEVPKGRYPPIGRGPPPMGPGGPIGRGPMGGPPMGPPGPPHHPFGRRGPPFGSSRGGNMPPSMHSHNGDYDGMRQGGKSFMNGGGSPHNVDHSNTTQQVTIPKDAAGAIIGKAGARIRKIRADSGASISIEDSRPGSNERIITISGSESQIKHAQYLLQQSVREYGGQSVSGGSRRF